MDLLVKIALVSAGSALGGLARWGVGLGFANALGRMFPWGTLFINITGSFFLGWFGTVIEGSLRKPDSPPSALYLHLLLAVGFTGAYTTFSTYELESFELFEKGESWLGLAYLAGSMCLGLLAVRGGVWLAR